MHHYKLCENVQSAHWADVCGAGATKVSTEEGAAFWTICEHREFTFISQLVPGLYSLVQIYSTFLH